MWTIKAWPCNDNPNMDFKHIRNLSEQRAQDLRQKYNSQGYGIVAIVLQRGRVDELESI